MRHVLRIGAIDRYLNQHLNQKLSLGIRNRQSCNLHQASSAPSSCAMSTKYVATADLCDDHVDSPVRLSVVQPNLFRDYGGTKSFFGQIETIRCLESNPLVRTTLQEPGHRRVLVVDGGGSLRVALLGDILAQFAVDNQWSGLIVYGCIRDSKAIGEMKALGVKALGTYPVKSLKDKPGERGVNLYIGGVEFIPGHWVYADEVRPNFIPTPLKLAYYLFFTNTFFKGWYYRKPDSNPCIKIVGTLQVSVPPGIIKFSRTEI